MKEEILQLRKQGLTYKQIKEHLGCSIGVISYHCVNNLGVQQRIIDDSLISQMQSLYDEKGSCIKVAKKLGVAKSTVLKHITVDEPLTEIEAKNHKVKNVVAWRKRKKQELIAYKGGACVFCGYNKSTWSLHFHHLDPSQKDFTITGKSWSFEKLKAEADKCILLCSNCHGEEHERLHQLKK